MTGSTQKTWSAYQNVTLNSDASSMKPVPTAMVKNAFIVCIFFDTCRNNKG